MSKLEWNQEVEDTIIDMRNDGCSWKEIAEKFDVSKETLRKHVNQHLKPIQHNPLYRKFLESLMASLATSATNTFNVSGEEVIQDMRDIVNGDHWLR